MNRVAVVGAGQIGDLIAALLVESGDYDVTLFDSNECQLARIRAHPRLSKSRLDVADAITLQDAVGQHDVVVNSAPYYLTESIARAAADGCAHYIDLTEDVASTRAVGTLAANGRTTFVPQCGLAPGIVSILAADIAHEFDELDTVKLKVGALPRYPSNALSYNLTWSPAGVVNEYCNPCTVILDGQCMQAPPPGAARSPVHRWRPVRVLQHLGGPRQSGFHLGRKGPQPELSVHSLSRPRRDHACAVA